MFTPRHPRGFFVPQKQTPAFHIYSQGVENKPSLSTLTGMSISKAQAAAIADGFLDTLGSDQDGLRPRESFTEIILLAGELIESSQQNLNSANKVASGALSASLVAQDPVLIGSTLHVDVMMNFYGAFVNKGVKGTKSGSSTAGYSFKYDRPSKSMVKAIQAWINSANISVRSVKKYTGHGNHEVKRKSIAAIDSAYAFARGIVQKGLKPTGFMDKAIVTTTNKVRDRIGAALKIDIIDSLKNI